MFCRCLVDGKCACFQGWTGAHCNVSATANECSADADCGAGRMCDGATRMCYCAGGYGGEECKSCGCGATGGDTCAATCDVDATCNSNGRCKVDGTCACFTGWRGTRCNIPGATVADECMADSDCGAGGVCNKDSGVCECPALYGGGRCESCECGGFGPGCEATCDAEITCRGNGRYVGCAMCKGGVLCLTQQLYIYIYIYTHIHTYTHTHIYI